MGNKLEIKKSSKTIKAHKTWLRFLCYSEDEKILYSGGSDGKVVSWVDKSFH
jgi:hypothetical protein